MKRSRGLLVVIAVAAALLAVDSLGQWRGRRRRMPDRSEFPIWKNEPGFNRDVFTFVRIQYDSYGGGRPWATWDVDYPDADWNFSFRLQQLTSFKVDPHGLVLRLTDRRLFNYPFIYMGGAGRISFSKNEANQLRKYLLSGGFLMVDDFWTADVWDHVYQEMKMVFPDREPQKLTLDHQIFHMVFDLKRLPQVTDIQSWRRGLDFEYWSGSPGGDQSPHFWAYLDDKGRVMALFCHNNDIADGWEREGENIEYFKKFSEKMSYPLGVNIITYAMTH